MKKKLWIPITIIAVALLVGVIAWLCYVAVAPVNLDISVEPVSQVNYNNYDAFSRLDYKGGELAWQSDFLFVNKLTILDDSGNSTMLTGISVPFQLSGNRVVYEKNGELRWRNRNTGDEELVAADVMSFIALEDGVLFLSDRTLYQYRWDGDCATISRGVHEFFYHNQTVYIFTEDGWLVELPTTGKWRMIYDFSGKGYGLPMILKFQGNYAIYEFCNVLRYISLVDGDTRTVRIAEGNHVNNRISYICDEERLFVSFQATHTDGSIVTDIQDENNGLWEIGSDGEKIKLSNQVFEELYLFEGNQLFGVRKNNLYQIDVETGDVTRITV